MATAEMSVQEIYEGAGARRDSVKSCRVVYTVRTRQFAKLPADEAANCTLALEPYRIHFCFEGQRRKLLREPIVPPWAKKLKLWSYNGVSPWSELTVFDGRISVNYTETSIATLTKGKHVQAEARELYCEAALGIPIKDRQRAHYDNSWFYPHSLRPVVGRRADYFVHAERVTIDGASTLLVEAKGFDKLWIDPQLGYAYRRRECYYGPERPHLVYRDTLGEFVQVQAGVFVPRSVVREVFPPLNNREESCDKPYLEMRFDVAEVAINDVTDADFRVELPAGTHVIDESDHKVYQVPGAGFDVLADLADKGQAYLLNAAN